MYRLLSMAIACHNLLAFHFPQSTRQLSHTTDLEEAAMPDLQYFSKLRSFLCDRPRSQSTRGKRAKKPFAAQRATTFALEPLEPRVLLAADLGAAVQAAQVVEPAPVEPQSTTVLLQEQTPANQTPVAADPTFVVINVNDSGAGSLRQAIVDANATPDTADTIGFANALRGRTINLTSEPLSITSDLTIQGLGRDALIIDGNGRDVFQIATSNNEVMFTGISIVNAVDGIEISTGANDVTVTDSRIEQTSDGIDNDGLSIEGSNNIVRVENTVFEGDGRNIGIEGIDPDGIEIGIFANNNHMTVTGSRITRQSDDGLSIDGSRNTVTVKNTLFERSEDNFAVEGPRNIVTMIDSTSTDAREDGIEIDGDDNTVTVKDSTFDNNGVPGSPNVVMANDGFDVDGARNVLLIEQVTFSTNGEDGLDIEGGNNTVVLTHSTITGNGRDGILNQSPSISPSIIFVGHTLTADNNGPDAVGNFRSIGWNLVGNADGSTGFNGPGDQVGTATNSIDAQLGPLQANGGPTFTHALLAGSPAIDAGDPNFTPPPEFDQRGLRFPRVVNGRIDIGAFEGGQPPAPPDGTPPPAEGRPDLVPDVPDFRNLDAVDIRLRNEGDATVEGSFTATIAVEHFIIDDFGETLLDTPLRETHTFQFPDLTTGTNVSTPVRIEIPQECRNLPGIEFCQVVVSIVTPVVNELNTENNRGEFRIMA
jgi:hypothetical protein